MEHIVIGVLLIACMLSTSVNAIRCSTCSGVNPCQDSDESIECPESQSCYQYVDNGGRVYKRGCLSGDCSSEPDYTTGDTDCRTCASGDKCNDGVLPTKNAWFVERHRQYCAYVYGSRDDGNQHYGNGGSGGGGNGYDPNDPNKKTSGGGSQYKSASTHAPNSVTVFSVFAALCVTAALY